MGSVTDPRHDGEISMFRCHGLYTAGMLTVLLLTSSVRAQSNTASASAAMIETALTELKAPAEKVPDGFAFKLDERDFTLLRLQNGSNILIKTAATRPTASLQAINRYNEEVAVNTRAVRYAQEGLM